MSSCKHLDGYLSSTSYNYWFVSVGMERDTQGLWDKHCGNAVKTCSQQTAVEATSVLVEPQYTLYYTVTWLAFLP